MGQVFSYECSFYLCLNFTGHFQICWLYWAVYFQMQFLFYRIYPDSLFILPTMSSRVDSCIAYINTHSIFNCTHLRHSVTTVNCGLSVLDYWHCQAYSWVNKPKIICINTYTKSWHFFSTNIQYVHEYMPELWIYASYFPINFNLLRHSSKKVQCWALVFPSCDEIMLCAFWIMGLIRLTFRYLLFFSPCCLSCISAYLAPYILL